MNEPAPDFDPQRRVCKIIAGALIGGVAAFLAIVVLIRQTGGKGLLAANPWDVTPPEGIISLIGLTMAAMMVVIAPFVSRATIANARAAVATAKPREGEAANLSEQGLFRGVFTLQLIVRFALYESAAFFNANAFFLAGKLPNLIAVLLLVALMVIGFPTRGAMEAFDDAQSERLRQERQAA
jgi:hypothetical protein